MNTFRPVQRDIVAGMMHRHALLEQPCEFFSGFFEGRTPTLPEKLLFIEQAIARMTAGNMFQNDTYTVEAICSPPFIHLDIRRNDGGPCKNWHDFQQIKNEIVGPEHEAVELFPADSRLVDTANQYHLWVVADPNYRFPFGFVDRFVLREPLKVNTGERGALRANHAEILPSKHRPTPTRGSNGVFADSVSCKARPALSLSQ